MIAAYQQLVARARLSGLKTMLCTLLPFEGPTPESSKGGYYTTAKEGTRQAVNHYIRNDSEADAIMDFDELMRDPIYPTRLRPDYNCGDHIHPNDAGYRAMAQAIDLSFIGLSIQASHFPWKSLGYSFKPAANDLQLPIF